METFLFRTFVFERSWYLLKGKKPKGREVHCHVFTARNFFFFLIAEVRELFNLQPPIGPFSVPSFGSLCGGVSLLHANLPKNGVWPEHTIRWRIPYRPPRIGVAQNRHGYHFKIMKGHG